MKRIAFITISLLLFFLILGFSTVTRKVDLSQGLDPPGSEIPPNIILILADDLGYGDLACFGHPDALTPNLDRLAKEGMQLTRFYAADALCSPSRASIMTAKHHNAFAKQTSKFGLGEQPTIPSLLKKQGYVTGHFGKWHLGPREQGRPIYGLDSIKTIGTSSQPLGKKDTATFTHAISFMESHKNQPFYINIWTHISHYPILSPDEYLSKFDTVNLSRRSYGYWMNKEKFKFFNRKKNLLNNCMKAYMAEVYALDVQIGRLLDWLDEHGLANNTLIIFTSDNGPSQIPESGDRPPETLKLLGYAGGLRGGKGDYFEGGVQMPFIIRWPERIPENSVDSTSVFSALDILPSLCSVTQTNYNPKKTDGLDQSVVWFGKKNKRKSPLFWRRYDPEGMVSMLDDPWKFHQVSPDSVLLYNLDEDPLEQNDLSASRKGKVTQLQKEIDQWKKTLPQTYYNNPASAYGYLLQLKQIGLTSTQQQDILALGATYGFDKDFRVETRSNKEIQNYKAFIKKVQSTILTPNQRLDLEAKD